LFVDTYSFFRHLQHITRIEVDHRVYDHDARIADEQDSVPDHILFTYQTADIIFIRLFDQMVKLEAEEYAVDSEHK
jgi:hypothetical protein